MTQSMVVASGNPNKILTQPKALIENMFLTHRHFTREALPRLDNYRNILSIQAGTRPTLEELHNATIVNKVSSRFVPSKQSIFIIIIVNDE